MMIPFPAMRNDGMTGAMVEGNGGCCSFGVVGRIGFIQQRKGRAFHVLL